MFKDALSLSLSLSFCTVVAGKKLTQPIVLEEKQSRYRRLNHWPTGTSTVSGPSPYFSTSERKSIDDDKHLHHHDGNTLGNLQPIASVGSLLAFLLTDHVWDKKRPMAFNDWKALMFTDSFTVRPSCRNSPRLCVQVFGGK